MRKVFVLMALTLFVVGSLTIPALAAEKLARGDKSFVKSAASGGMMEVEMGQLAAQNAASDDVKAFGQRMVTDHGKVNDELKGIATAKNVKLPTKLGMRQKAMVDKLAKLKGAEFDKKYMETMVKDHEKDVSKFRKASATMKDPDIKAFAAKTLPTLEDHLKQAKEVATKVGAEVK